MKNTEVQIWCDGACSGNPGPGGWAAMIRRGPQETVISGKSSETTNNRMELAAAIKALEMLVAGETAVVYSDSKYVVDGMTSWVLKWKQSNWITSTRKLVSNKELWLVLDELTQRHKATFKWVRGHSTEEIDYVDSCAKKAIYE